jgi:hypothetical protein
MIVESSSWMSLNVEAIANYDDSIKISEKALVDNEKCYISNVKMDITESSAIELYEGLRHYYGDCDDHECKYCEEVEE